MEQFFLESLTLTNYRKFSNEVLDFDSHMNVLIGADMSGKTSVLEAVCVSLGAYLATYKKYIPSRFIFNMSESDVYRKIQQMDMSVYSDCAQYPCIIEANLIMNNMSYKYSRILDKKNGRTKFNGNNPMRKQIDIWEKMLSEADGSDGNIILPMVLCFNTKYLWNKEEKNQIEEGIPGRLDAYFQCLDQKRGIHFSLNYLRKLKEIAA